MLLSPAPRGVPPRMADLGADPTIRDPGHYSTPLGWVECNHQREMAAYVAGVS